MFWIVLILGGLAYTFVRLGALLVLAKVLAIALYAVTGVLAVAMAAAIARRLWLRVHR